MIHNGIQLVILLLDLEVDGTITFVDLNAQDGATLPHIVVSELPSGVYVKA
jgi:hypothetical protein